jgi:hypothetical protein
MGGEVMDLKSLTERETWVMARALFYAAKRLRGELHPPLSDIEDMESVLREHFGGYVPELEFTNDLKRAIRLGFKPEGEDYVTHAIVLDWLAKNGSNENVVALFDR